MRTSDEIREGHRGSPSLLLSHLVKLHEEYRRRKVGIPPHPQELTGHKSEAQIANDLIVLARTYADELDQLYPDPDKESNNGRVRR